MDVNLFTTSYILIIMIILSVLSQVPMFMCQHNQQYDDCGELFDCGNIPNILYPFWGSNRSQFCGHPMFELNCQGDTPLITIESTEYRVLEINNTEQFLTVARNDMWNEPCPIRLYNTTLDFTLFNYAMNQQRATLHYGCNGIPGQSLTLPSQFDCNNRPIRGSYFMMGDTPLNITGSLITCTDSVLVMVNRTSTQILSRPTATINDLRAALASGFQLQWTANNMFCTQCVQSGGVCGSNSGTAFVCHCADQSYSRTCNDTTLFGSIQTSSLLNIRIRFAIGFSVCVAVIIIFIVIIYSHRRKCSSVRALFLWKKERMQNQNIEAFIGNYGSIAPKQYKYSDVRKMTNLFREKLGQGGYGSVYKGILSDGRLVAVKLLNETKGDGEEFINEVASISRTSHVNVVTLLGFCYQGSKRALIYEFMPNGSLDKFIYKDGSPNTASRLEWKTLYQIAIGTARGLEYLHRGCNTQIVHFDIKPQNILLDEDFCPKIADFGLAKLCQRKKSIVSIFGARGTAGYIAPEVFCRNFGSVSHKSDVYSYGMMVLEMAGARKNNDIGEASASETYFPDWIYEHLQIGEGVGLQDVMTAEEEETANKMVLGGLWCIQTNPADRPSMSKVVEMLEGSLQSLQIPPKPVLFSHPRSPLVLESLMSLSSNWDSHESLHSISAP